MKSRSNRPGFADWIGFKNNPEFGNARFLGRVVGTLIILTAVAVAVGGIATLFQFLAIVLQSEADDEAIRNIGLVVAAVLGAPFVLWRAIVAQKQADTAEQSHITDQINKAVSGLGAEKTVDRIGRPVKIYSGKYKTITRLVKDPESFVLEPKSQEIRRYRDNTYLKESDDVFEGLHIEIKSWEEEHTKIEWQGRSLETPVEHAIAKVGDWSVFSESLPNIEVRVGAIYALERIAQDSPRDHIQVMEIMTAYVRENAPVRGLDPSEEPFIPPRPRTDIQVALDVIGRRTPERIALEHSKNFRLDLREVDLSGADFSHGNFEGALLFNSRLEASRFRYTNLSAARLQGCLLNFSVFFGADLCGAMLDHATINRLNAWNGSIVSAKNTRGLSLAGADISAIMHLPSEEAHSPTFGTRDTILADHIERERKKRAEDIQNFNYLVHGIDVDDEEGVRMRLEQSGFLYWSPYDASDGTTNIFREKFRHDIGLKGFPFDDY